MTLKKSLTTVAMVWVLTGCGSEPRDCDPRSLVFNCSIGGFIFSGGATTPRENIELKPHDLTALISKALLQKPEIIEPSPFVLVSSKLAQSKNRWTIADSHEGRFTTDWRPIKGKKAGLLWWEKTYDTEVRHVITVTQSFRNPQLSSFSIATEVRERPNEKYPWAEADSELGRASFEEIKNHLLMAIDAEIARRKSRK